MKQVCAVILAAGKGTRLKANKNKNKVVFEIASRPMITYTIDNIKNASINDIIVVVGHAADSVKAVIGEQVTYATQQKPKGTADAFKAALPHIPSTIKHIICMYGDDSAFYPPELLHTLVQSHIDTKAAVTMLTLHKQDPTGLGRIIRDQEGNIIGIVEEKNATTQEKKITEINTGLYCFEKSFITEEIENVKINPVSQEYYLTDIIQKAVVRQRPITSIQWQTDTIWHGVNTPEELADADQKMQSQKREIN